MHLELLKSLVTQIDRLQEILVAAATGTDIKEVESEYRQLKAEIETTVETLQEVGSLHKLPQGFDSLWNWYRFYRDEEYRQAQRGKYVYDLYANFSVGLWFEIAKFELTDVLDYKIDFSSKTETLELLTNKIAQMNEHLNALVSSKDFVNDVGSRDSQYRVSVRETFILLMKHNTLEGAEQMMTAPLSLWQCYGIFQEDIRFPSDRETYIDDLSKVIKKAIDKYMLKANLLNEDEPLESQPTPRKNIANNTQATANKIRQYKPVSHNQKELACFVILTAIEAERLAVCKAFEVDTDKDREFKDARVYWKRSLTAE